MTLVFLAERTFDANRGAALSCLATAGNGGGTGVLRRLTGDAIETVSHRTSQLSAGGRGVIPI